MCQAPAETGYFTFSISVHPPEQNAGGTISMLKTGKGFPLSLHQIFKSCLHPGFQCKPMSEIISTPTPPLPVHSALALDTMSKETPLSQAWYLPGDRAEPSAKGCNTVEVALAWWLLSVSTCGTPSKFQLRHWSCWVFNVH